MNKWNELTPEQCKEVVFSKYQDDEDNCETKPWRLLEALTACGRFENIEAAAPVGPAQYVSYMYADDELCRWWFYPDLEVVWIGVKESFDRWANSRDFVAAVPRSQKELDWLFTEVDKQVEAGNYDRDCGREMRLAPNTIQSAKDAIKQARAADKITSKVEDTLNALECVVKALEHHRHPCQTSRPYFE